MFLKVGLCMSYGGPSCRKGKDYVVGAGDYNRFGQEEVDAGQFTSRAANKRLSAIGSVVIRSSPTVSNCYTAALSHDSPGPPASARPSRLNNLQQGDTLAVAVRAFFLHANYTTHAAA